VNTDKFTVHQGDKWSSWKEHTLGLMDKLKQFLVPRLKSTPPGCRQLYTEPNNSKLGLKSPPRVSSPHSMELIFEGEVPLAPPPDESIDGTKAPLILFEPYGVM